MAQVRSLADFERFCELAAAKSDGGKPCLVICAGTGGLASGSNDLIRLIKRRILQDRLQERISLRITGCLGFCEMDPFILVEPGHQLYARLRRDDVPRVITAAMEGNVLEDLLYREPGAHEPCRTQQEIPFFKGQTRTILGHNQQLDPIRILDYLRVGGYRALLRVLADPNPDWIIAEVKKSGLRGRGGAGFPTGRKWELARRAEGRDGQKFVVCNGDEGDPGAYMDRSLLEGNPHAVIEGMIIAGIAIGATQGIVYVRTEYPLAIRHAQIAIGQAQDLGLLGDDILGTGLAFAVQIVRGAGAFVCGEETALIKSVEGKSGEPRQRPPYPIVKGIFGHPTCINNVETLANVPVIISQGAETYAKVGVPGNTGTKIFSLVGKIKNTGLVEVPLGTPLAKVVYDIGGGPLGKKKIKAVQTGGPSGGCIPASMFDLPISYESLTQAGSIMGSGGMIVMDENTCMVDVAKYFMAFLKEESCGKCFTCRKGTQRMHELLDDISRGKATAEHLQFLEELAGVVKDTTLCGLGQSAPNPVLSTLRYFRDEFERHIKDKKCDAFVCKDLVGAPCQAACPVNTEPWRYLALLEQGDYQAAYHIIREANPFPSVCARACDRKCEHRCSLGVTGGQSLAIRALKRFVTDRVEPAVYKPIIKPWNNGDAPKVAVVGAGPAGLTAAHCLSLQGYRVTVFEAEQAPGGMLICSLPAYRLPRGVVEKEIQALLNENIELKCGIRLGREITLDGLLAAGFKAIFLALGAHESWRLELDGEDVEGIYPSMEFLKAFNLRGEELAHGHVGIVGGGNSAVDAARVALRQQRVKSVTLLYRRTRDEMPAYEEEVEAALEEGVRIETLVSPVKIYVRQEEIEAALREGVDLQTLVSLVRIYAEEGRLTGIQLIRNRLGEREAGGRRKPVPVPGTEFRLAVDTLIVAIGERPQSEPLAAMGLEVDKTGRVRVDPVTLCTSRPGVFAGGDLVTGPNTVIDAIAAGKRVAPIIARYLAGQPLTTPAVVALPKVYIPPPQDNRLTAEMTSRAVPPTLPVQQRHKNFAEVEQAFSADQARTEARRCLRCDMEFTQPQHRPAHHEFTPGEVHA